MVLELPDSIKKEDIKQLSMLLPNASDCFLASLLPLADIFGGGQGSRDQAALCQCLKHFFREQNSMQSRNKNPAAAHNPEVNPDRTVILATQLTVPGVHT